MAGANLGDFLKNLYLGTEDLKMSPVLGITPHDDDLLYRCGGYFRMAASSGAKIHVAVVTDGSQGFWKQEDSKTITGRRRDETIRAYGHLGIPENHIIFLGLPDRRIYEKKVEGENELIKAIRRVRPRVLFQPAREDRHRDHTDTHEISTCAAFCLAREPLYADFGEPATVERVFEYNTRGSKSDIKKYEKLVRKIESSGGKDKELFKEFFNLLGRIAGLDNIRLLKLTEEAQQRKKEALGMYESQRKLLEGIAGPAPDWETEEFSLVM